MLTCYRAPLDGRYRDQIELPWPDGLSQAVDQLVLRLAQSDNT